MNSIKEPCNELESSSSKKNTTLNIENLLLEEYKCTGAYIIQALQDRQAMFTMGISLLSALTVGLGYLSAYQKEKIPMALWPFIFFMVAIFCLTIFWRIAYLDSLYQINTERMNRIRKYYRDTLHINGPVMARRIGIEEDHAMPKLNKKIFPVIYPLFPGTMMFVVLAFIFIGCTAGLLTNECIAHECINTALDIYRSVLTGKITASSTWNWIMPYLIAFVVAVGCYALYYKAYLKSGYYYRVKAERKNEEREWKEKLNSSK